MSLTAAQKRSLAASLRKNPLLPLLLEEIRRELLDAIADTKPHEAELREVNYFLARAVTEIGESIESKCSELCRGADKRN